MNDRGPAPRFDSHARDYRNQCEHGLELSGESKEFFARGRLDYLRRWWERSGRAAPRAIVDYGCGIGDVSALLAETFPAARVIGADPSSECIGEARREHGSERVRFETLEALEGAGVAEVDLVHVNGVVHHVRPPDRPEFFRRCAGLLAPDGVLAVFENNPWNPGTRLVMRRIDFDRDAVSASSGEVKRRLETADLRVVDTRFLFVFPRALRLLRPLERHLERLPIGAQYGVIALRGEARRG